MERQPKTSRSLQRSALVTLVLGVLSTLAIVLAHLALTDIWHGEGSLELEWTLLRIAFGVILLFHVSAFRTVYLVLRATYDVLNPAPRPRPADATAAPPRRPSPPRRSGLSTAR